MPALIEYPKEVAAVVNLMIPHQHHLATVADRVLASARDLMVDSHAMYEAANDDLGAVMRSLTTLVEKLRLITDPLRQSESAARDVFRPTISAHEQAIAIIKTKMLYYMRAVESQRAKERAAAEEIAREQATIARVAADALRVQAERVRRNAEEAAATMQAETAAATRELAAQEAHSCELQAAEIATVSALTTAALPLTEKPKAQGAIVVKRLRAQINDLGAAVRWIGAHPEYLNLVDLPITKLSRAGQLTNGKLEIDGVEWIEDMSLTQRSR